MTRKILPLLLAAFCYAEVTLAQTCTAPGQNPSTSVGVCGTSSFGQTTVPICGDRVIKGPCTAVPVTDKNPFWYQFTCFTPGTLGFTILPTNLNDDYDWQLFDVTGHFDANGRIKNDDVYNDLSMFVACNWSGEPGLTGASAAGTNIKNCDGLGVPTFSSMPTLKEGHEYILLISHFTDSQSGYSLTFGGGTASITDPTPPHLKAATVTCDGTRITISLNKKMKCSSLLVNGSEFSVSPVLATVTSATGIGCNDIFSTLDLIELTLDKPLPPGDYTVTIKNGTDGNTLLDKCNAGIPGNESVQFTVKSAIPTAIDSLRKIGCAPDALQVVMQKPIKCSSIAADGSDFIITGNLPVTVISASGNCNSAGFTSLITVKLAAPIQKQGIYQLKLVKGIDGNTLENDCGKESRDTSINFLTKDTVSALFTYSLNVSCEQVFVNYFHDGKNGVYTWKWQFDDTGNNTSDKQNPEKIYYATAGPTITQLIVSNGTCSDTASATINIPDKVTADFEITDIVCPGEAAKLKDRSLGNINSWNWDFGNGNTSILQSPPGQFYPVSNGIKEYIIILIVSNPEGCIDTLQKKIKAVDNCYIAVPSAFSPNNDGLNDYLYPLNAYKATDLHFRVYNRFGQLLFETGDWTKKWDGSFKGQRQDGGTYVWVLQYINKDTGNKFNLKGTSILIR